MPNPIFGAREEVVKTVLVIDDQVGIAGSLQQKGFLRNYERLPYTFLFESCHASEGYDPELAVQAVARETDANLVLLDLQFGLDDESLLGLEILRRLTRRFPNVPVLVMSSKDRGIDLLGRCLEEGAVGFVEKHKSPEHLRTAIERAVEFMRSHVLLGQSAPLKELRRQAARLSPYDQIPVLIVGERGTGKERVARYIHQNGPRRQGPFVAVNCAGVPAALFETELFGLLHDISSGPEVRQAGYLDRARGGTLFLDGVSALPHPMQAKLLRVLKDRSFGRPGMAGDNATASFQLISATESDPQRLVADGTLTSDFFDAIAAVVIQAPPLRDCLSDVPLLANDFLRRLVGENKRFTASALNMLASREWPGNARELQRVVQEAAIRSEGKALITTAHLARPREASLSGSRRARAGWHRRRLIAELEIAIEAKAAVQAYKGNQWKAEFMREVYPHCKSRNAKGFADLVKRLTHGPWGEPKALNDPDLEPLLRELER